MTLFAGFAHLFSTYGFVYYWKLQNQCFPSDNKDVKTKTTG